MLDIPHNQENSETVQMPGLLRLLFPDGNVSIVGVANARSILARRGEILEFNIFPVDSLLADDGQLIMVHDWVFEGLFPDGTSHILSVNPASSRTCTINEKTYQAPEFMLTGTIYQTTAGPLMLDDIQIYRDFITGVRTAQYHFTAERNLPEAQPLLDI
jgi:hypothetical protein